MEESIRSAEGLSAMFWPEQSSKLEGVHMIAGYKRERREMKDSGDTVSQTHAASEVQQSYELPR